MHINDLSHQTAREVVPGYRARFVHSDRVTLAYWDIEAGAALPEHAHPHEQLTNVISGKFQLTIAGETHLLEPGWWPRYHRTFSIPGLHRPHAA
jgi:quercetin dioxygenase-like cupin family protein